MSRLGVCFVGAGGAVASTVIAGITLMKRGLAPRIGMVTETDLKQTLSCAPLDSMVFGGWDLRDENIYEAAVRERILGLASAKGLRLSSIREAQASLDDIYRRAVSARSRAIPEVAA